MRPHQKSVFENWDSFIEHFFLVFQLGSGVVVALQKGSLVQVRAEAKEALARLVSTKRQELQSIRLQAKATLSLRLNQMMSNYFLKMVYFKYICSCD